MRTLRFVMIPLVDCEFGFRLQPAVRVARQVLDGRYLTMRDLGLLRVVQDGWRGEQTSNSYELLTTAEPPVLPPRCGGHP
jgi:hypothetical protein